MKTTGRYCALDASEEENLDNEMEQEIHDQRKTLHGYAQNMNSLLGKRRANELRKAMINILIEQL